LNQISDQSLLEKTLFCVSSINASNEVSYYRMVTQLLIYYRIL